MPAGSGCFSSGHNVRGAAGRRARPCRGGPAWVLAPPTFCRPDGWGRALRRKTGETATQRCPRPQDCPARSGRDGPGDTCLCSPEASRPRQPRLGATRGPGPGDGGSVHPVLSPRPNPGGRLNPSQFPSPLRPHSALLSLLPALLKCTREKLSKTGARPLRCHP